MGRVDMDQNAPPLNSCKNTLENENRREKVKVVVRLRPEKEGNEAAIQKVAFCNGTNEIILVPPERNHLCELKANESRKRKAPTTHVFTFDGVMSEMTPQSTVYEKYVASLVQSACRGWNATVFAYGCTSSGKSYTMQGVPGDEGIMPRALQDIFKHVNNSLKGGSSDTVFSAHISFVELYNGKFRQLLEDEDHNTSKPFCCSKQENWEASKIEVRETKSGSVYLIGGPNLKRPVTNLQEAKLLVCVGNHRRATRTTDCNAHSSRSHAILTIYIERSSNNSKVKVGKIHLVDLAGSERASMSGAIGDQMLELQHNNLALSNLGLVLQHLSCCQTNGLGQSKVKVPYRNNKLTHFLKVPTVLHLKGLPTPYVFFPTTPALIPLRQDSIGGNSKTLMISTLRTISEFYQLSLTSLLCSSRARHIQNITRLNFDFENTSHIARVRSEMMGIKHGLHERTFDLNQALDLHLALHRDGAENSQELKKKIKKLSIATDLESDLLERKLATVIFTLQHRGITQQRKQLDSLSHILRGTLEKSEEKCTQQDIEISHLRQSLEEVKEGMAASLSEIDAAQNLKQQVLQARQAQTVKNSSQALEMVVNTFLEDQKTQLKATEDKGKGMVSAWLRVSEVAGITTAQGPVPVDYLCAHISDLVAKVSLCDQYRKQISVLRMSCFATSAALVGAQRLIARYTSDTGRNNPLLSLEFDNQHHSSCHIFDPCNKDSTTAQPTRPLGVEVGLKRLQMINCAPLSFKSPSQENNTLQPTFEEDHDLAKHTNGDDESNMRFALKQQQIEKTELELSFNQAWKRLSLLDDLREQQPQLPLCSVTREKCGHKDEICGEAQDKSKLHVVSTDTTTLYETQSNVVPECGVVDASSVEVIVAAPHQGTERDPVQEMQKAELHLLQYEYQCREAELKSALKESRALVEQIRVSYTRAEKIRRAEILTTLDSQRREKQIIWDRCNELQLSMKTFNDLLAEAYNKILVVENSEKEVRYQLSRQESVTEEFQVELDKYKTLHSNAQQELVNMGNEQKVSLDERENLKTLVLNQKSLLQESQKRVSGLEASNKEAQHIAAAEVESLRSEFKLKFNVAQSEWQAILNAKESYVSELQQDQTIALNKCNTLNASVVSLESSLHESRKQLFNLETVCKESQGMAEVEVESLRTELELKLKMAESDLKKALSVNETHEAEWCYELTSARHERTMALKQYDELRNSLRILESSLYESQHMAVAEVGSWRSELQLKFDVARSDWQAILNAKESYVSELQQDQTIALNKCNTLNASVVSLESSLRESRKQLFNLETVCIESQGMAEVEVESWRSELQLKFDIARSEWQVILNAKESYVSELQQDQAIALNKCNTLNASVVSLESSLRESRKQLFNLETVCKESQGMAEVEVESLRAEFELKLKMAESDLEKALNVNETHEAEWCHELTSARHERTMALKQYDELRNSLRILESSLYESQKSVSETQHMAAAEVESWKRELKLKLTTVQNEFHVALKAEKIHKAEVEQGLEMVHHEKNMAQTQCNELRLLVTSLKVSLHKSRTKVLNIEQVYAEEQNMVAADFESLRNEFQWKLTKVRSELDIVQNATKSCGTGQQQFSLEDDIHNHTAHKANGTDLSWADTRESRLQTDINMVLKRNRYNSQKNVTSNDLQTIVEMSLKNSLAIERHRVEDLKISCKWTNDSHVIVEVYCPTAHENYKGELDFTLNLLNLTRTELEEERISYASMLKKTEDLHGSVKANLEHSLSQAQKRISEQEKLCADAAQLRDIERDSAIVQLKRCTCTDQTKHEHCDIELNLTTVQYRAASVAQQPQAGHVPLEEVTNNVKAMLRDKNDVTLCCGSRLMYLVKGLHSFLNDACIQLGQQQDSANEGRLLRHQQHIYEIQTANYLEPELRLPGLVAGTFFTKEFEKQQDEERHNMVAFNQCCCNNLHALEENNLETWLTNARDNFLKLLKMVDNNVTQARTLQASLEEALNTSTQAQAGRVQSENALATAMLDLKKITQEYATVLGQIDELNVSMGTLKEKLTAAHNKSLELDALREEAQFITASTESTLYELEERLRVAQTSNAVIMKENVRLKSSSNRACSDLVKLQNIYEEKHSKASELELMKNALEKQFCMYKNESTNIQQNLIRERTEVLDRCNSLSVSVSKLENLLNVKFQEISELKLSHKNNFMLAAACQESSPPQSKLKRLEGQLTATQNGYSTTLGLISTPRDDSQLSCCFYGNTLSCTDPVAQAISFVDDKKMKEVEVLQQTQAQMMKEKEKIGEPMCCKDDLSHVSEVTMYNHDEARSHHPQVEEDWRDFPQDFHFPSKNDVNNRSCFIQSEGVRVLNKQQQQSNGMLTINENEGLIKIGNLESSSSLNGDGSSCDYKHIEREISRMAAATSSQVKGIDKHLIRASNNDTQPETAPLREIYEQQLKLKIDITPQDTSGEKTETDENQTLHHESSQPKEKLTMANQSVKLGELLLTHSNDVVAEERKWSTSRKGILQDTHRTSRGGMKGNCQPVIPRSVRQPLQQKHDSNRSIRRSSANLKASSYDDNSGGGVVEKREKNCLNLNNQAFLTEENERDGPNKSRTFKYKYTEIIDGLISKSPIDQHGQPPPCGDGRNDPQSVMTSPLVQHLGVNKPSEVRTVRCVANELFAIGQQHCVSSRDRRVLLNIQPLAEKVKIMNGGGVVNMLSSLLHHLDHKKMNLVQKRKIACLIPEKENIGPGMMVYR